MDRPGTPDHLNSTPSQPCTPCEGGALALEPCPQDAAGLELLDAATAPTITGGFSKAFKGKRRLSDSRAWGASYAQQTHPLEDVVNHWLAGDSAILAAFSGNTRTNETFLYTQAGVLDFEAPQVGNAGVAEALAIPFNRKHAFVLYPTASSGKVIPDKNPHGYTRSRMAVRWSESIYGVERARAMYRALREASEMPADKASDKPAQPWHGSTNRVEQPHVNLHAEPVNVWWLAGYLVDEARAEMERDLAPKPPMVKPTGSRAENYAAGAIDGILRDYYAVPGGAEQRHDAFLVMSTKLIALKLGGWHGTDNIEATIYEAGRATERPEREIADAIKWAYAHAEPKPFELPAHKPKKSVRRRLEKSLHVVTDFTQAIKVAHVSDNLTPDEITKHPTLLIEGGTGLGKSTAVAAYTNGLPDNEYITAIAQFRLLTDAMHKLLEGFAHYEQADGEHQRALGRLKRLVTSLSSLAKFDRHSGRVVIDEITGVLKFLAESGTFRGGEALAAFRALVRLIEAAVQVVGMDANLDDITIRFIEKYRGKVTVKRYQRAEPRGKVTLLSHKIAAIYTIEKLLSHRRGQVFAPCSSEATTTQIAEHFTALGYRVLKITRDTSNTEHIKRAVRTPALREDYDLIAYDSACGAGVDFAERIYAQVAIFDRMPLAPEDAIQLFGRVRHAQRRYAAVPPEGDGHATSTADELLADVIKRETWTARLLKTSPENAGDMLELAQLWAQFKARQLRETARWRYYFAQRLQADGFTVAEINVHAPEAFAETWKQWKAERDDQHFAFVLNAIDQALADDDLDRLRLAGVEITSELTLRNTRWQIETAKAASTVNEQDRDLMKRQGRRHLFHLRDWFSAQHDLKAADQEQRDEGRPIHKRRYSTLEHEVLAALFKLAGHEGQPEDQLMGFLDTFRESINRDDVAARYAAFATPEAMSKFKALGHYGNNAETISGLCRWLLDYFGLKLVSERRRVDGKLTMFYRIDDETLDYRLNRARYAAAQRRVIRNVYSSLKYTKVITPAPEDIDIPVHLETDWALEPEAFNRQFGALTAPVGRWL